MSNTVNFSKYSKEELLERSSPDAAFTALGSGTGLALSSTAKSSAKAKLEDSINADSVVSAFQKVFAWSFKEAETTGCYQALKGLSFLTDIITGTKEYDVTKPSPGSPRVDQGCWKLYFLPLQRREAGDIFPHETVGKVMMTVFRRYYYILRDIVFKSLDEKEDSNFNLRFFPVVGTIAQIFVGGVLVTPIRKRVAEDGACLAAIVKSFVRGFPILHVAKGADSKGF